MSASGQLAFWRAVLANRAWQPLCPTCVLRGWIVAARAIRALRLVRCWALFQAFAHRLALLYAIQGPVSCNTLQLIGSAFHKLEVRSDY